MYETKTITAENTFTDAIGLQGFYNISIQGTFVATVTLQRSFDEGSTWEDVSSWEEAISTTGYEPTAAFQKFHADPDVQYRLGIKTGDFTSGTVNVRLGV